MESYQKEIALIKQILKDNPKGMTVTDVSRKININRNSVAKYLDVMRISGFVEMITFGPAKVFFPSRRVPISNLINFASEYIVVLDKNLRIVMINDAFLEFMQTQRESILAQTLDDSMLPMFNDDVDISSDIREALEGKKFTREITFHKDGEDIYLRAKGVPITFEDGRHGVSLIIKNITNQKIAEKALRGSEEQLRIFLEKLDKTKK